MKPENECPECGNNHFEWRVIKIPEAKMKGVIGVKCGSCESQFPVYWRPGEYALSTQKEDLRNLKMALREAKANPEARKSLRGEP